MEAVMVMHKPSAGFKKLIGGAMDHEVLIPAIRAALWNPDFKGFDLRVEGFEVREWDGWFHPSTHPTWPERLLWFYLQHDDGWQPEPFEPESTMAVTQGKFWHLLVQKIGVDLGILRDPGICPCGCGQREFYCEDRATGSRGHYDGQVNSDVADVPEDEVFEFKTMRPSKYQRLPILPPGDPLLLAAYRKANEDYYGQGQDYMRMTGIRRHRTLVLSMEYPFDMKEIVMPFDWAYADALAKKYRGVRQDAADHRMPDACCNPKSAMARACPARAVCPVGLAQ
jgi:hypothetical protein